MLDFNTPYTHFSQKYLKLERRKLEWFCRRNCVWNKVKFCVGSGMGSFCDDHHFVSLILAWELRNWGATKIRKQHSWSLGDVSMVSNAYLFFTQYALQGLQQLEQCLGSKAYSFETVLCKKKHIGMHHSFYFLYLIIPSL